MSDEQQAAERQTDELPVDETSIDEPHGGEPRCAEAPADIGELKRVVEAILLAAGRPLSLDQLLALFTDEERPERDDLRSALACARR